MNQKTARVAAMVEPVLCEMFTRLALKKGLTVSGLMRALILDELQIQGMLPEETTMALLKGGAA